MYAYANEERRSDGTDSGGLGERADAAADAEAAFGLVGERLVREAAVLAGGAVARVEVDARRLGVHEDAARAAEAAARHVELAGLRAQRRPPRRAGRQLVAEVAIVALRTST